MKVIPDHLGSTQVTTDVNSAIQETVDYYPYGATRVDSGTASTSRQFIGQYFDAQPRLSYLNARYYNGDRGGFLSQDPSHLAIGNTNQLKQVTGQDQQMYLSDPQQLNSYSYARDNPVVKSDPTGRAFGVDDAAGAIGGGFVGGAVYLGSSAIFRQQVTLGGLAGSVVSGGITGWGAINAPETGGLSFAAALAVRTTAAAAIGGAGGFSGNLTKQFIDIRTGAQTNGSISELAASTGFGFVTGGVTEGVLPNARIPVLSAGRGNWNSVGIGLQTKMSNGLIGGMSATTAFKSAVGSQASNSYKTFAGGILDVARSLLNTSQQNGK